MKLEIIRKTKPTHDSISLYFKKIGILEQYKAGQHALLSFNVNGVIYKRTYSFHTSPYEDGNVGITVRAVDGGLISNYLQSINGTAEIFLDGVSGEFTIEPGADNKRHLVMFAAGSGITPIISMLKTILYNEHHSTVSLIYSNRGHDRIIFRNELLHLEKEFQSRLSVYHILTQEANPPSAFPVFYKGRLSKLITKKILKTILAASNYPVEYYLCGPLSFMQVVEETIHSLNPESAKIYKEIFFIPEEKQEFDFERLAARHVILQIEGPEQRLIVPGGKSILQSALDNGFKLRYSCMEGQCGTCRAQLITGEVKLRKNNILTEVELRSGQILLCQGFPTSDGVTISTSL